MQAPLLSDVEPERDQLRVYSLCLFTPGGISPTVQLIDATTDAEAIAVARGNQQFKRREVWDHHRLVAVIPPAH